MNIDHHRCAGAACKLALISPNLRSHYKSHGIIVTIRPEQNLHHWLDPDGPYFQHAIYQSVDMPRMQQRSIEPEI